MADVRCSNCGKNNPAGTKICQYCGTPLTAAPSPSDPGSSDPSDWLNQLRANDSANAASDADSEGPSNAEPANAADVPDWLSRVRQRNQSEGDENTPDWLQGLVEPSSTSASPAQGDADWLSGLRDQVEETPPAQPEPPAAGEDWFSNLDRGGYISAEGQPATDAGAPAGNEDQSETDFSNWLQGLNENQPTAGEPVEPSAETPAEAAPDADLGAWLASLGGEPTAESDDEAEAQPGAGPEEIPDWMAGEPAAPVEEPAASAAEAENVPDWLASFTASESGLALSGEAGAGTDEPDEPGELPTWISAVGQDLNVPAEEQAQGSQGSQEEQPSEELPDWMMSSADQPSDEPAEQAIESSDYNQFAAVEETVPAEGDVPAAMDSYLPADETMPVGMDQNLPAEEAALAAMDKNVPSGAEPEAPEEPEDETPDWLKTFGKAGAVMLAGEALDQSDQPAETSAASAPFVDEDLPAWLNEVHPPADSGSRTPAVPPLIETNLPQPEVKSGAPFNVDLPAWMDQEQPPADAGAPEQMDAEQPAEGLAMADLPAWVEDMRPLESVLPGDVRADASDTRVEKAGPLAGMRGLLPGEDLVTRYRKPPIYSARLNVSERQRQHAQLLESVLLVEAKPQELAGEASRAPQIILRLIMALLLVLALLPMLLPGFELLPVPTDYPAGLTAIYNQVENLPANAAVLVATDYEPGLSGEMRFAADSVVEHLMVKNARMVFVSTVPTGPVLADQMLVEVNARQPQYSLAEQTLNLGYLPGGTTSLLQFAIDPRAAAPVALDSAMTGEESAWGRPVVTDISKITDFALVIVMTDNGETGRAWIEQVKREMGSVPLTMVTSAQAGPLLLPYLNSNQIQGITSGLTGGAMYEQKSGRMNLANQFWGSYQSGSLAGVLLLIVGGVFSVILKTTGQSRKKKA